MIHKTDLLHHLITLSLFVVFSGCLHDNSHIVTNAAGTTLKERIPAPAGYEWVVEEKDSFGAFLQKCKVKKQGSQILDFNNKPIHNQSEHAAILEFDVGSKDLQQCADAVIRLHAEYLYEQKRFDEIGYHFTNGDLYKWSDYKKGIRPKLQGSNKVEFVKSAEYNDSYEGFRKYLDIVFMYAGTISLNKETVGITNNEHIKTGDILITPGSPGHVAIIAGSAKNKEGKRVYLLAQGYTPAQSVHVITNPFNGKLNPWYDLNVDKNPTITARYTFTKTNIRSFR